MTSEKDMNKKSILTMVAVSAITALVTAWSFGQLSGTNKATEVFQNSGKLPANYASFNQNKAGSTPYPIDFTSAATAATPAVVHIKTKINARTVTQQMPRSPFADLFGDEFFGDMFGGGGQRQMRIPEQRASGSGVIMTNDGYIADEINVTLPNKKSYKAELIGADPSSDLAVLKINGEKMPFLVWGNSDEVRLGQWVLAIGYPWSLDVTVTAGIVSAKARSLGLNRQKSQSPIESFIQTDAAVNQGNSGGALVDTEGRLIGINSAIASQTGSYAGYSYAIPVNIVRKIVGDLIKYGTVQRAYLGVNYIPDNVSDEELKKLGVKQGEGVYVSGVSKGGAAEEAGLKEGDYITAINDVEVSSSSEMVEQIANFRPGDKINITYKRDGKEKKGVATLKNISGNTEIVKAEGKASSIIRQLGGELKTVDSKDAKLWGIKGGVQVTNIGEGLLSNTRMQEDFVITSVSGTPVTSVEELAEVLSKNKGNVRLEGVYPGYEGTYAYPLNLSSGNSNGLQQP
ncbi:MAG: trypsin-like peptidase domain-containing protein [Chitinophagaceae bacterium]|nr:trypsin-like peptidase domain-containing protein [Chitinophagaceae bacterium]